MDKNTITKEVAEMFVNGAVDAETFLDYTSLENADAAAILATSKEEFLFLEGVTFLSVSAAEALTNYEGRLLMLDGLTTLPDTTAQALSKAKCEGLALCGLDSISDITAEALASFSGKVILLDRITFLSDAAVIALGSSSLELSLNSLSRLSESVWDTVSKHEMGETIIHNIQTKWTENTLSQEPDTHEFETIEPPHTAFHGPSEKLKELLAAEKIIQNGIHDDENLAMIEALRSLIKTHGTELFDPENPTDQMLLFLAQEEDSN